MVDMLDIVDNMVIEDSRRYSYYTGINGPSLPWVKQILWDPIGPNWPKLALMFPVGPERPILALIALFMPR